MNVKKAAAIFLALMAALTFLSRALDSFTVIRVKTGYGKQDDPLRNTGERRAYCRKNGIHITAGEHAGGGNHSQARTVC
ncbi:MAG: hypothetical protein ACLR0U_13395 [Enterocloster clostridioformis]